MEEHTIVIVDDDPDVAAACAAGLDGAERSVLICSDVEAANQLLERQAVELILIDIHICHPSAQSGLDLVQHVHRDFPGACIVAMTALPSADLTRDALHRGAVAVLTKPFSTDEVEHFLATPWRERGFDPAIGFSFKSSSVAH